MMLRPQRWLKWWLVDRETKRAADEAAFRQEAFRALRWRKRRRSFSGIVGQAVTRRHTLVLVGLCSLITGCGLLGGPGWFLVFNALMAGWYAMDILVIQHRVAAGVYGETAPEVLAAANFVIRERGGRSGRSGGGGNFDKVFETAADTASSRSTVHAPGEAAAR
jgi:hypothetical protein